MDPALFLFGSGFLTGLVAGIPFGVLMLALLSELGLRRPRKDRPSPDGGAR